MHSLRGTLIGFFWIEQWDEHGFAYDLSMMQEGKILNQSQMVLRDGKIFFDEEVYVHPHYHRHPHGTVPHEHKP